MTVTDAQIEDFLETARECEAKANEYTLRAQQAYSLAHFLQIQQMEETYRESDTGESQAG